MSVAPVMAQLPLQPPPRAAPSPAAREAERSDSALGQAQKLYNTGKYDEAAAAATKAIEAREWDERWWILKTRAQLARGKVAEAQKSYEEGLDRFLRSVQMRLVGYDVYRAAGDPVAAEQSLDDVRSLAGQSPRRYGDAERLLAETEATSGVSVVRRSGPRRDLR